MLQLCISLLIHLFIFINLCIHAGKWKKKTDFSNFQVNSQKSSLAHSGKFKTEFISPIPNWRWDTINHSLTPGSYTHTAVSSVYEFGLNKIVHCCHIHDVHECSSRVSVILYHFKVLEENCFQDLMYSAVHAQRSGTQSMASRLRKVSL